MSSRVRQRTRLAQQARRADIAARQAHSRAIGLRVGAVALAATRSGR